MKIPRRKPAPPSQTYDWDQLVDFINNPGNWKKFEPGEHSHDVTDPGHSHGVWTVQEMIDAEVRRVIAKEYTISRAANNT